jgi:arabinogalactan oligomer / maltooligosaccharide transport system permease protein
VTALALWLWGVAGAAELELWHSYRGEERAAVEQAIALWADRGGHTVGVVALPFGAYDSKLETAIPRGNGPDVFIAGHGTLGKWSAMELMVPVATDLAGHTQASRSALAIDEGHAWGHPLAVKSIALLYDPTRVKRVPTTTEELIAAAKEHTGDGGFGLAYQASEPYFHAAWLHAFGGRVLDEGGVARLNSQPHVDALAFARRIAIDEGIAPQQPTAELITRLYNDGRAAFVLSGPWFAAEVSRPVAAALLPIVDETGVRARPFLTVEAAFVAHGADPEAHDLAAWLAAEEAATLRTELGRQVVTWASVKSSDPLVAAFAEQAKEAVPLSTHPDTTMAYEAIGRALRDVARGAADPQAAADAAQSTFAILARPQPPASDARPYLAVLGALVLGVLVLLGRTVRAHGRRVLAHWRDYAWIAPAGIALLALVVLPFVTGASVSLFAHHQGEWTFVGIRHYLDILLARDWPVTSPLSFVFTLAVTILWTVTNLTMHVGLGVALALVLREPWVRLRTVWRALLILPWAVPNYITALIWKGMFHTQYGAINAVLGAVTLQDGPADLDWFGSFCLAFSANLATNTWLGFPFMMVVTLGALQSIPPELEEAAEVDGASWWFRLRHITLPLLVPALLPAVILGSVWTFYMFNVVYLVSAGEPNGSTEILISEAYRWAFSRANRYGYAAAYAVVIFGVLLVYARFANRLAGRRVL